MSKADLNARVKGFVERIGNALSTKTWRRNIALFKTEEAFIPALEDHNKRLCYAIEQNNRSIIYQNPGLSLH